MRFLLIALVIGGCAHALQSKPSVQGFFSTDPSPPPEEVILPAPAIDVSSLARAEYQRAEQEYAAGNLGGAEAALERSWNLQHHPLTRYNLALVHLRQRRFTDANTDLMLYFGEALPSEQDPNNAHARKLVAKIRHVQDTYEPARAAELRSEMFRIRKRLSMSPDDEDLQIQADNALSAALYYDTNFTSAEAANNKGIQAIRAGNNNVMPELDLAFERLHDFSVLYWIVLGEFRSVKASLGPHRTYQYFNSTFLGTMRHLLLAYMNGTEDRSEFANARRLLVDIMDEEHKAQAREKHTQHASK